MNTKNVWFVKGASKRPGLSLVKKISSATSRIIAFLVLFSINAKAQTIKDTLPSQTTVFPKGEKMPNPNLTGMVWMNVLVAGDSTFDSQIANVTFEPGARTNWHTHPGGQILLVTEGIGYYQEKGKPLQILHKGDVVKCVPNITHWHGASPASQFAHIGITPNHPKGRTLWLQKVTDEEYNRLK
jgi:quercetin dioxygenase-like cupin family protein